MTREKAADASREGISRPFYRGTLPVLVALLAGPDMLLMRPAARRPAAILVFFMVLTGVCIRIARSTGMLTGWLVFVGLLTRLHMLLVGAAAGFLITHGVFLS